MTIQLNGESREVAASSVPDLIGELGLAPETVLIELNGLALLRTEWPGAVISEGARVEILRVAAGG